MARASKPTGTAQYGVVAACAYAQLSENRTVLVYRGVNLPDDTTPECVDRLLDGGLIKTTDVASGGMQSDLPPADDADIS